MKVLISHDVDHLTSAEHFRDLIIPKYLVRSTIEYAAGYASFNEVVSRMDCLLRNRMHNIGELMECDSSRGVSSTFFIAVSRGRNLQYRLEDSAVWINRIVREGFDVGVHGIEFGNYGVMRKEFELFREISGLDCFGIRVHDIGTGPGDVKITPDILHLLDRCGYLYSSNTFQWREPFKAGTLWEFPINIMDGYIWNRGSRWQNRTLAEARKETMQLISRAADSGAGFFNILFHDLYFGQSFTARKEWYLWLLDCLKECGLEFVSYRDAVSLLEREGRVGLCAE